MKDTKRTDKADLPRSKEQANQDIIEDIKKDNLTEPESSPGHSTKMGKIEDAIIVNTLKDGIKEALKDVATTSLDRSERWNQPKERQGGQLGHTEDNKGHRNNE